MILHGVASDWREDTSFFAHPQISLNTFFGMASYVVVREVKCLDELLSFAIKFPSDPPVVDNVLNNSILA